jgi:NAD+ synthase (glutamine-hydrolysing)
MMTMTKRNSIKVFIGQMEVIPGRPVVNSATVLGMYSRAVAMGADIAVFPEMAIPGYLVGDAWERTSFIKECEREGDRIVGATAGTQTAIIFGNVGVDWSRTGEDGRPLKYNAAFVAEHGRLVRNRSENPYPFLPKTLMPNYREFDDSRHFSDCRKLSMERSIPIDLLLRPFELSSGVAVGAMLCEDGWDSDYSIKPIDILCQNSVMRNADVIVNCSCSPYTMGKNNKRNRVFSSAAARNKIPVVYANCVGMQDNGKTIYMFDGSSCVYDVSGRMVSMSPFVEEYRMYEVPLNYVGQGWVDHSSLPQEDISMVYDAVATGCCKFMKRIGAGRVVIGASGGVDSAVVSAIFRSFLDPHDMLLVNMPSKYNSGLTRDAAGKLASNLGCEYTIIGIQDSVDLTSTQIRTACVFNKNGNIKGLELGSLAMENVQARDRSSRVLAACASAFGGVFTCNGNKSEITVGYCTLYGDVDGFMAPIGDLWKGQVYDIAKYINRINGREIIPVETINVVPSAELSNDQDVTKGKGDPIIYGYHDRLFASWVERWNRATPEDNLRWYLEGTLEKEIGYDGKVTDVFHTASDFVKDLERWWKLYTGLAVAKRIQAPPIMAVSRRVFGWDMRESQLSDGSLCSEEYQKIRNVIFDHT